MLNNVQYVQTKALDDLARAAEKEKTSVDVQSLENSSEDDDEEERKILLMKLLHVKNEPKLATEFQGDDRQH
jgi:hypothetical protein